MSVARLLGTGGVRVSDLEVSESGMVKSCIGETQRPPDAVAEAEAASLKLNDSSGIDDRLEVSGSGGGGGGVRL
eukprot:10403542-Alexandrium_andersonii.AAC.1